MAKNPFGERRVCSKSTGDGDAMGLEEAGDFVTDVNALRAELHISCEIKQRTLRELVRGASHSPAPASQFFQVFLLHCSITDHVLESAAWIAMMPHRGKRMEPMFARLVNLQSQTVGDPTKGAR